MVVFMHARASKAPYHRMRVNATRAPKRLKPPETGLFVKQLVQANTKGNIEALYNSPFVKMAFSYHWISLKRVVTQNAFSCIVISMNKSSI